MNDADYGRISVGQGASAAKALIEDEIRQAQYDIDMAMFRRVEAGTLTGEIAMMAFARKRHFTHPPSFKPTRNTGAMPPFVSPSERKMALESPLPERIFETDDEGNDDDVGPNTAVNAGLTADQLKEILASEREANEARMRQVLGGQAQRGVPLQVEESFPEINVDATGLPHPSVDIEGFLKGYGERTNKAMQEALKEVAGRVRRDAVQTAQVVSGNQGLVQRAFDLIREAAPEMEMT